MKKFLSVLALTISALIISVSAYAQFTTSSLNGRVVDENGLPLPGAAVIAVHTPTGSQYYALANESGYYTIDGMRPGGPYTVTISLVGCKTVQHEGLVLALSETYQVDASLVPESELLDEAGIIAVAAKFTAEKTGVSTNVSNSEMMNLPNSDRSISAIAKLSPYSNGMNFAGSDGRSTNFSVDGANLNNNFGLSANLPGGGSPISLDAIEEMQIVIAPYDVRQSNFVGGGINAVTKSGTNTFKGTAYAYYTNQNFRGNVVAGKDLGERKAESNLIAGATIGGPIIKDKLFFFVNFEIQKQPEQAVKHFLDPTKDAAKMAVLDQISQKLQKDYGYNPGSYTNYPGGTDNMKILARIDWNISDAHKLSVRFNQTNNQYWYAPNGSSCDDRNKALADFRPSKNRDSEVSQPFSGNMYSQMNNVMSITAELNSRLSDKISNKLLAAYTNINDQRGSNSAPFPHVDIMTEGKEVGDGFKQFTPYTSFGYELFTWNNGVKNNNFTIQDNVTFYLGSHTVVAGLNFEQMSARNSYMRNGTAYYRYASPEDFLNDALPLSFCLTYGYDGQDNPAGIVKYNQTAAYVQDEWKITRNFKLTYGLRGDLIAFDNSAIKTNPNIAAIDYGGRKVDTGVWPTTRLQVSPRVGFNWDVNGDKSLIVRGGTGFFQGRLPLVFFTNMPQNSGMIQGTANIQAGWKKDANDNIIGIQYSDEARRALETLTEGGKMMTDVKKIVSTLGLPTSPSAESAGLGGNDYIGGVDPNFRMPQIWKTSVAVDYKVPVNFPFTVTAEGMFNKTIWGVTMEDWNIDNSKLTATFAGSDNRVNYNQCGDYNYAKTSAYVLANTQKGYGYTANLTVNMEPVKNLKIMAAYTHTESKEITGLPGSAANSAYTGIPTVSGLNLSGVQRSQYVLPDKVMANISYFIPWKIFGGNGLHINAYYTAASSFGNSFVYTSDMNGDGIGADLIYIPKDINDVLWKTPEDGQAFMTFVNNDKYLSAHKGQYAEAYAARAPWVHRIDLRIAEDFSFKVGNTTHNFQAAVSIDNIGNMINNSWGVQKLSGYQSSVGENIAILNYEGVSDGGKPVFSMKQVEGAYPTQNYTKYNQIKAEAWSILFSLKYFFN
ncbi:MAG: TonB-dependent receptor [Bacteroidales bacterium]|nr:TonB-dependent receptor [Bacteroidales bacterium]